MLNQYLVKEQIATNTVVDYKTLYVYGGKCLCRNLGLHKIETSQVLAESAS